MAEVIVVGESSSFVCVRCGVLGFHLWRELCILANGNSGSNYYTLQDEKDNFYIQGTYVRSAGGDADDPVWVASLCAACNQSTIWRGDSVIYPRQSNLPAPHPDMPKDAKELYEEARGCYPISPRAAAALARASLEHLLRGVIPGGERKSLDELIASLGSTVRPGLWKTLTAVRVLGNDSLHGNDGELVAVLLSDASPELTVPLFSAINALVEELITQPRVTDEIYAMIPESKREDAERKAT